MNPPDEYIKALEKAAADLSERVQKRDLLNAEIAGFRETVRVLSSRVKLPPEKQAQIAQLLAVADYATPSLSDAILALLTKRLPEELTAVEVRNALEESGFNFDEFSNPLSACHAALKRFSPDEVATGTKEGKTTYKRILNISVSPLDFFAKSAFYGSLRDLAQPEDSVLPNLRNAFGRPKTLSERVAERERNKKK